MEVDVTIKKSNGELENIKYNTQAENREKRTERIYMKILPSLKEGAEKQAAIEGRSLSNYIEKLIKEDLKNK